MLPKVIFPLQVRKRRVVEGPPRNGLRQDDAEVPEYEELVEQEPVDEQSSYERD